MEERAHFGSLSFIPLPLVFLPGWSLYGYMHEAIMIKKSTCWATLIYGSVLIGLGYYGYHDAGSKISLYTGSGFGLLMILSSLLMFWNLKPGLYTALLLTVLLTGTFAVRYSHTHKGIPALLSVMSAGMLIFLLVQTAKWKR